MATVTACVKTSLVAGIFAATALAAANVQAQGVEYNYLLHCGGCHIEDGSGMPPHVPDLRVEMPLFAASVEGRAYIARVPGVIQAPMNTQQLTDVLNMILSKFAPEGSSLQSFTEAEITLYQQEPLLDPKTLRDQLLSDMQKNTAHSEHLSPDI
jgi:cytochrome c peroxidase